MTQSQKTNFQPRRHGQFKQLAEKAEGRKAFALSRDNGLGGNGQMPHTFCRELLPIVLEYDRSHRDIVVLYAYLIAHTNGDKKNDRYMAAFPAVETIDKETGINKDNIRYLSDVLEAIGMLETALDRTPSGHNQKLYYPQYYSEVPEQVIRKRLERLTTERKAKRAERNARKNYAKLTKGADNSG